MSELGPTVADLHAEIGRTLVVWGWLESEMIDAGLNWGHISPALAEGPLKAFLTELVDPRSIRNALAHGLASAHSEPWKPDFEPYVTCRTRDAGLRKITLNEMREAQSQLQRLRNMLRGLAQASPQIL